MHSKTALTLSAGAVALMLAAVPANAQDANQVQVEANSVNTTQPMEGSATRPADNPHVMGVSLELLRDAEVVGMENEEIGDVTELVRSTAQDRAGLNAIVNVDNGWFEEDRQIVVPIGRFTVLEGGKLRLDNVTADNIDDDFATYEEREWTAVDREYETYADAYEGYGWDYF